ncbi:protein CUSTOS isoform X2 [Takifugu rubripes]|uniref:protein CUSTOS isoform X2 n=1 Tax=Takifugu rubripes TaxID=31033 RepID=UPI001145C00F|nr:protein CUSTOS isoform X2 [Takifugu rubripes]
MPRGGLGDQDRPTERVVVIEHEHDGNELQVSQGFRTHVARKLEHLLDSIITDTKTSSTEFKHGDNDDDDKGFRLFTTSIPGQTATEPKAPARRPPVPSSSDSDSEMETRIKEAAVSIEDLLPSTAVLASFEYGQIKENVIEKKKKKKRPPECTDDVSGHSEKDVLGKVKRKKKRRAAKEEATT